MSFQNQNATAKQRGERVDRKEDAAAQLVQVLEEAHPRAIGFASLLGLAGKALRNGVSGVGGVGHRRWCLGALLSPREHFRRAVIAAGYRIGACRPILG